MENKRRPSKGSIRRPSKGLLDAEVKAVADTRRKSVGIVEAALQRRGSAPSASALSASRDRRSVKFGSTEGAEASNARRASTGTEVAVRNVGQMRAIYQEARKKLTQAEVEEEPQMGQLAGEAKDNAIKKLRRSFAAISSSTSSVIRSSNVLSALLENREEQEALRQLNEIRLLIDKGCPWDDVQPQLKGIILTLFPDRGDHAEKVLASLAAASAQMAAMQEQLAMLKNKSANAHALLEELQGGMNRTSRKSVFALEALGKDTRKNSADDPLKRWSGNGHAGGVARSGDGQAGDLATTEVTSLASSSAFVTPKDTSDVNSARAAPADKPLPTTLSQYMQAQVSFAAQSMHSALAMAFVGKRVMARRGSSSGKLDTSVGGNSEIQSAVTAQLADLFLLAAAPVTAAVAIQEELGDDESDDEDENDNEAGSANGAASAEQYQPKLVARSATYTMEDAPDLFSDGSDENIKEGAGLPSDMSRLPSEEAELSSDIKEQLQKHASTKYSPNSISSVESELLSSLPTSRQVSGELGADEVSEAVSRQVSSAFGTNSENAVSRQVTGELISAEASVNDARNSTSSSSSGDGQSIASSHEEQINWNFISMRAVPPFDWNVDLPSDGWPELQKELPKRKKFDQQLITEDLADGIESVVANRHRLELAQRIAHVAPGIHSALGVATPRRLAGRNAVANRSATDAARQQPARRAPVMPNALPEEEDSNVRPQQFRPFNTRPTEGERCIFPCAYTTGLKKKLGCGPLSALLSPAPAPATATALICEAAQAKLNLEAGPPPFSSFAMSCSSSTASLGVCAPKTGGGPRSGIQDVERPTLPSPRTGAATIRTARWRLNLVTIADEPHYARTARPSARSRVMTALHLSSGGQLP